MRLLISIILALFAAVGLALLLKEDPGYVLISIGQWTIETSVAVLVVFLVAGFLIFFVLLRLLIGLLQAPRNAVLANRRRQVVRSARLLTTGLRQLVEGRWKNAEITLLKGAEHSKAPALHYLGAARAAQRLNEHWRRDGYLTKAEDGSESHVLPSRLTRAELLLENQEATAARDVLLPLRNGDYPRQTRVLELLARCYQSLGEWGNLRELLPELGKFGSMDEAAYRVLREQAYAESLTHVAHTGTLDDLHRLWKEIPAALHTNETLLLSYAGALRDLHAADEAELLLRAALNKQWSDKLVVGYGEIGRGNSTAQLAAAEAWLKQHPEDSYLLLTCGRLARRSRQFEKARGYLEQSLKALTSPDAYQELGEVLEEGGNKEGARHCYHTALNLLSGRTEEKEGVAELAAGGTGKTLSASQPVLGKDKASLTQDPQPSTSS